MGYFWCRTCGDRAWRKDGGERGYCYACWDAFYPLLDAWMQLVDVISDADPESADLVEFWNAAKNSLISARRRHP